MSVVQKWLAILGGLGALVIVGSNGKGFAAFFDGAQKFISGTEHTAITGQK